MSGTLYGLEETWEDEGPQKTALLILAAQIGLTLCPHAERIPEQFDTGIGGVGFEPPNRIHFRTYDEVILGVGHEISHWFVGDSTKTNYGLTHDNEEQAEADACSVNVVLALLLGFPEELPYLISSLNMEDVPLIKMTAFTLRVLAREGHETLASSLKAAYRANVSSPGRRPSSPGR